MNTTNRFYCLILYAALITAGFAGAPHVYALTDTLFEVTIPTSDTNKIHENQLISDAGALLIGRLTGQITVPEEQTQYGRQQASQWIQSYRYVDDPRLTPELDTTHSSPIKDSTDRRLLITFNPKTVLTDFQRQGWTVWSPDRPTLLVWLWQREEDGSYSPLPISWVETTNDMADRIGLPVLYPSDKDQRQGEQALLLKDTVDWPSLSNAYHTEVTLVGIKDNHQDRNFTWLLWSPYAHINWQSNGSLKPDDTIREALQRVTDHLKTWQSWQSSSTPKRPQSLSIHINNLPSLTTVARITHFLDQDNDHTRTWQWNHYQNHQIDLTVVTADEEDVYLKHLEDHLTLTLDHETSTPVESSSPDEKDSITYNVFYRWLGA